MRGVDDRRFSTSGVEIVFETGRQTLRTNNDEACARAARGVIFGGSPRRYSVDLFTARTRRINESFISTAFQKSRTTVDQNQIQKSPIVALDAMSQRRRLHNIRIINKWETAILYDVRVKASGNQSEIISV